MGGAKAVDTELLALDLFPALDPRLLTLDPFLALDPRLLTLDLLPAHQLPYRAPPLVPYDSRLELPNCRAMRVEHAGRSLRVRKESL